MKRVLLTSLATVAAFATVPALAADATVTAAGAHTVYDSTVSPLPPNLTSLGFEATGTGEFGDAVTLAGTSRQLDEATVTFSTWALRSQWADWPTADGGWTWPVTVTVYPASNTTLDDPIGAVTETITVPWRPESNAGCPEYGGVRGWSPADSTACYNGKAFNATFDLSSIGEVPAEIVVTAAYNTRDYGAAPTGVSGPYDSLNVAVRNTALTANGPVPVGTDTDPDAVVLDSGTGELRTDTGWAPYTPAFALTATSGGCAFAESGTVLTLLGDCTTDETIAIPAGFTLDGDGHTITAVDPTGGHFTGAVLTNADTGSVVNITDLTVTASGLADVCDAGAARLRGILLDGVGGTITGVTVTGVRQGSSGCQEGNAIEARNFAADGTTPASPAVRVSVTGSTVSNYQKNAITFNGGVVGTASGNTVSGDGPVGYIAQNGIQVGFGASGTLSGNTVTGNYYTGIDDACGVLLYQADGVRQSKNSFAGNEKNICNYGRGGGQGSAA